MATRKQKNTDSDKGKPRRKLVKFVDFINCINFLPFPVILTEKQGKICFCNEALKSLLNNKNNQTTDTSILNLVSKEYKEKVQLLMSKVDAASGSKQDTIKITGINKRSKLLDVSVHKQDFSDKSSMLVFYFLENQRKNTNEDNAIKFSLQTEKILEFGNIGLWKLNLKNNLFRGNTLTYKVLGLKCPSRITEFGKFKSILAKLDDKEAFEKNISKLIRDNVSFDMDFRIRTENKEKRVIKFIAGKLDEFNLAGTVTDITEKRKIERELIKSKDKAEKADHFKSAFLTNLSHELRTPMNAILGFTELLKQDYPDMDLREDYTRIIKARANDLLSLIDDINELAKFETGQIVVRKSLFPLLPVMKELYDEFDKKRIREEKTNISLEMNLPEGINNVDIYTDQGRLQQVISILLSNALKFTEKGAIEFGFKPSEDYFRFFVNDTGIGMSEDEQENIFHRFSKIEETSPKRYGKSGFSLTISRHIVEMLGGKIKVKSEGNKGSRFQFSIPVEKPERVNEPIIHEIDDLKNINWKDKVILIVEDEDVNYRFLETVLHRTQAQILRAANGIEAVELCKKIPQIDIVLMDIKMPKMNGYEATVEIRKFRKNLPVIAQTAFSVQEEITKCLETGCVDYITKPIDIKLLIEKINTYI